MILVVSAFVVAEEIKKCVHLEQLVADPEGFELNPDSDLKKTGY